jgi:hypothetical protein
MKRTRLYRWSVILLLLVLGIGQVSAVVYSPYRSTNRRVSGGIYSTAEAAKEAAMPISTFQSTSTLSGGTRSDASTPLISTDGSVAGSAYMGAVSAPAGPRQAPGGPGTPGGDLDPATQQPLGDALIPLLLLAFAYAIYKVSRRRAGEQIAGQ